MTYNPRKGSIASKALEYLASLPKPGQTMTNQVLADAIGCDAASLGVCIQPAIKAGRVCSGPWEVDKRKVCYWLPTTQVERLQAAIGTQAQRGQDPAEEDDKDELDEPAAAAPAPDPAVGNIFALASSQALSAIAMQATRRVADEAVAGAAAKPIGLYWPHAGGVPPKASAAAADTPDEQPRLSFGLFDDDTLIIQVGDEMRAIPPEAVRRLALLLRGVSTNPTVHQVAA